jgi:hypothetical protein
MIKGGPYDRRPWVPLVLASVLGAAVVQAKDPYTVCSDVCDTLTATTCDITGTHTVTAGSDIDCTTARDITIDGGTLSVHDGLFTIRGKSLTLTDGGLIEADCPQDFIPVGFSITTTGGVSLPSSSAAKLTARCEEEGGRIAVDAGGDITIDGLGINANGTSADAPGGSVRLSAGGTVSVAADVFAEATGGAAHGGTIRIDAAEIAVTAGLKAQGYGNATDGEMRGGEVSLNASGDISVTAGPGINVQTAKGGGGDVVIAAGGAVDLERRVDAGGTGGSSGAGGSVEIRGQTISITNDIVVVGGREGGGINVEAGGDGVAIGTTASATLNATGNSGGGGGSIAVRGLGGNVTLGGSATFKANGPSGGHGGTVTIRGVDVTTASGTTLQTTGPSPSGGGSIFIVASGDLDLDGTMTATTGGGKTFVYRTGTPTISSGITGYDLVEDDSLPVPCGDGIRNDGNEDCDIHDLGGETCASQSQGTGTLACDASCDFDYSGCSGS